MSAEEAAAKADALIAQYRATAPRAPRAAPRIGTLPAFGLRTRLALVLVCAFVAGLNWRAHPAWGALLAACAFVLAFGIARLARRDATADDA